MSFGHFLPSMRASNPGKFCQVKVDNSICYFTIFFHLTVANHNAIEIQLMWLKCSKVVLLFFFEAEPNNRKAGEIPFDKKKRINFSLNCEDILRRYKEYIKIHHIGEFYAINLITVVFCLLMFLTISPTYSTHCKLANYESCVILSYP